MKIAFDKLFELKSEMNTEFSKTKAYQEFSVELPGRWCSTGGRVREMREPKVVMDIF